MNGKFIRIDTYSGYRGCQRDPTGVRHIVATDAENSALGDYVLKALSQAV
ncbi:contact-dependent growth inhibition system immunity protein [Acerihabitans sp. KWT182]|uniref:Contact-dependent growth inhibition system immunity protein n=1 Tax=Acerihabitans sp. KWT182 TaxID=3157919 RepID=A0AAU7Q7T6_9GAMM